MRLIAFAAVLVACGGAPEVVPARSETVIVAPPEPKPSAEPDTATESPPEPERATRDTCKAEEGPALAKAKQLFSEGVEFYERGEYGAAITSFRDAYELSCSAQILYNIGRAHEQLGEAKEAIDAYQRYLEASGPEAHNYESLKRQIEVLKQKL